MTDIFIAYSHEDLDFKNEFKKFLRPLMRDRLVSIWDDYDIEAGEDWDAAIKERLYGAGVVLLLVSADSLASDYFYGKEVEVSLARHARGEAVVVPVVLRHCDWKNTPLGELEALPEKGRPVVQWASRDEAWQNVVERLRGLLATIEERRKKEHQIAGKYRQYTAAVTAAEHLAHKKNWQEARQAYTDALALHQPGLAPDRAEIKRHIAECDRQIQAGTDRQRTAEKARLADAGPRPAPPPSAPAPVLAFNARPWLFGGGGVLVLVLMLWLAFGGSGTRDQQVADDPLVQLEAASYHKALEAGTVPALQAYLAKYPAGSKADSARQKLGEWQQEFSRKVNSARSFEAAEDWKDALARYEEALRINPEDAAVRQKVEALKK